MQMGLILTVVEMPPRSRGRVVQEAPLSCGGGSHNNLKVDSRMRRDGKFFGELLPTFFTAGSGLVIPFGLCLSALPAGEVLETHEIASIMPLQSFVSETAGRTFNSCRAHHLSICGVQSQFWCHFFYLWYFARHLSPFFLPIVFLRPFLLS